MLRSRRGRAALLLSCVALLPACQRATSRPVVNAAKAAEDFHPSDPLTIAATGRPQLLEFFGVT